MRSIVFLTLGIAAGVLLNPATVVADPIFNITSVNPGVNGTAEGTSSGIGFSLSPTFIADSLTITDGSYVGFSNSSFHNPPLATSDVLHVGSEDFTLTFDETISSALIYVSENGLFVDGALDFGIQPTIISGNITLSGTRINLTSTSGGLVRLDGIDSTTLSHTSSTIGGVNMAIVMVPEPYYLPLMISLLGGLAMMRLRRAAVDEEVAATRSEPFFD